MITDMKIGLIDVDGYPKKKMFGANVYPNLALCKIAGYHKKQGDYVEWYDGMFGGEYDIVYMAKIFNFTPGISEPIHAKTVVKGGTGYDVHSRLPDHIDGCQPDYSIYPCVPSNLSYGFLTRGCPNRCFWCVVPSKEGSIRPYQDIRTVANGRPNVILMDNNILAAGDYAREQLDKIISMGLHVDFNQALDARLVDDDFARQLAKIRWIHSRIRFGCDTNKQVSECERAIKLINSYGYNGEYFLYTILAGNTYDHFCSCVQRIEHWRRRLMDFRKGEYDSAVYCHAQPYRDPVKPSFQIPQWQKDMAAWCNKRMIFYSSDFIDYRPRKNFQCSVYFDEHTW